MSGNGIVHGAEAIKDFNPAQDFARLNAKALLQQCGLDRTFWGQRIIAAEERGYFDVGDEEKGAQSWTTCACGTLDPRIPRSRHHVNAGSYAPVDNRLAQLGALFGDIISGGCMEGLPEEPDKGDFVETCHYYFGGGYPDSAYVEKGREFIAATWVLANIEIEAVRVMREQGIPDDQIFGEPIQDDLDKLVLIGPDGKVEES